MFDARGDAGARPRLVPRLRLAAGADPAAAGLRGALRVGLLDPAQARRRRARRPVGRQRGRHRSARLDRGVPARRRLDRARSDQRPARRRGAHPARLHRAAVDGGADHGLVLPGAGAADGREPDRRGVRLRDDGAPPRTRRRASPSRTPTSSGRRSRRSGARSTAIWTARRAPDDGRRADLRLDRRSRRRRVEHRRARPGQARGWRIGCCAGCARGSRPAACCTTARASGTRASRCRAGRSPATSAGTASRSGASRAVRRRRRRRAPPTARPPQAFIRRSPAGSASIPGTCCPPTRTSTTTCGASAACRERRRARQQRSRTSERARLARVFAAGLGERRRLRAAAARADPERLRPVAWESGAWSLRGERLFLIPGDSPMGFRLPLDTLPWEPEESRA